MVFETIFTNHFSGSLKQTVHYVYVCMTCKYEWNPGYD